MSLSRTQAQWDLKAPDLLDATGRREIGEGLGSARAGS